MFSSLKTSAAPISADTGLTISRVSSRDFVPVLYLLDAGGNLLSFNSGAEIRLPLTAGDYVALVVSPAASGGGYTLASQFADGPFPRCLAAPANPGDKLAGMLTPASCWSALGPADIYSVTLPASGTFEIDPGSTAFDGILALRDSKDNLLVVSATTLSADLAAGTYTIVAAAATGSGAYQLAAAFTAHDIPPCDYVQALELDGGYIQKLRPGSCRDTDGQPMDVYEFTLPSDSVVLAVMTSSQVDGLLRLTDADGNILRTDHGSYSPNDPMIVQFLKAGKYRLQARAASGNATGYYQVDLRTTPGPRPPFCAPKGRLAPGDAIDATLSYTGCQYASTFADIYQIGLTGAATIDLRLASGEFNAYLVLLDAKGHVVAEDDDSGGGTDAEITVALPAGTYWAVAGPLSDYYHVGRYTLSLR